MENNKRYNGPRRGPGRMSVGEKAKDFKGAITRLFNELKGFKILIFGALILAALSSVLSIFTPNKLSDLTDMISDGLVVNTKNIEILTNEVTEILNEETLKVKIPEILDIDITSENIEDILTSSKLSSKEKQELQQALQKLSSSKEQTEIFSIIGNLSDNTLSMLLPESTYDGITISSTDKIELLKIVTSDNKTNNKNIKLPTSVLTALLEDTEIDGVTITSSEQAKFITILSETKTEEVSEIYSKIDEMPESIKEVVKPKMNMTKITNLTLFLVAIYICSALFNYIQSIVMTIVSNNFARNLRSRISSKINRLPLKYFDKHQTGDVLSRVTNDVDTIAQSMNQSLASLVSSVSLFIGTIIMMFYTNYLMALTAILSSLIGFVFMSMILGKSQKYFTARQVELGNLNGHIEEVYSGLNVVKAYNGKEIANKKFDEYNKKVYDANRKSHFLSGLMMPMMGFIGNFGYVAVCIVGALLTLNNKISFGVIVAFISYVRLFTSPLSQIAQAFTSLQTTAAASERVFELFDEEEMVEEKAKKKLDKTKVKGNIEFKDVVFKYDGNDKPTIKNFSAKALSGEKIAIVGPTGAGKTTMVNLLMRFYELTSGDILIDGVSIKDLTRENIHELFTMVLQDTWIFDGTVKENIAYNLEDISDDKIKEVCKIVGLDHFIKTLPNSYDTHINDNETISAGQKQLLTIARGMMKNAPFLILDEATSNVDTRTEELVQKAMDELTKGRTSFIIAHRLSTIKNADLILVMKDGNIIEQGNHDDLIKKNGFYAELYNSQFEL